MRISHGASAAATALLLMGCSGTSPDPGPTNPQSGNGAPTGIGSLAPMRPFFSLASGALPYPTDLFFNGSTDGTLRTPVLATSPNAAAINQLDGYSTVAPITVRFSNPIDATTINATDVIVIRAVIDSTLKAPIGAAAPFVLTQGVDYRVYVAGQGGTPADMAQAVDGGGTTLVIEPLHALDASTPESLVPGQAPTNAGYIVVLTNGIMDTSGNPAAADADYATVRGGAIADITAGLTTPKCAGITDPTLNAVCQLTFAQLGVTLQVLNGTLLEPNPFNVVLSFSFSTESTSDTLNILGATYAQTPVAPGTIVAAPTGATSADFVCPSLPPPCPIAGTSDMWVGVVTLPYYLTAASGPHDTAPVTTWWTAAGPPPAPLDPMSRVLTRFNPIPVATSQQTVPLLVGVPNSCGAEPAGGWPAVVFVHGITRNRSDMLALVDSYTSQCIVVAAIDHPLHGITDTTSPLYRNQLFTGTPAAGLITGERTFDLDLQNNATGAPGPDGVIDGSGTNYINLTSFPTMRDNLRQSESDTAWLGHVLPTLSLGVTPGGDINAAAVQLVSQSLGSITSIPALAAIVPLNAPAGAGTSVTPYLSGALSVPGGGFAYLARDSGAFGPVINAALATKGLVPGMTLYDNFVRDAQTVIDAGDPVNYIATAVYNRPILMQQVVGGGPLPPPAGAPNPSDQVVPNSATARLLAAISADANDTLTRITQPPSAVTVAPLAQHGAAYVNFIYGQHGSILSPAALPGFAASGPFEGAATVEMQFEAVGFALESGQAVLSGAPLPPPPAGNNTGFVIAP
jgi:hypothetical protein